MPWEHTVIEAEPGRSLDLVGSLNRLAAEGWEVVGFGTVARGSVGYTIMSALLRRWYEPLPPPTVTDPAWLPDPAGRHQGRWWDRFALVRPGDRRQEGDDGQAPLCDSVTTTARGKQNTAGTHRRPRAEPPRSERRSVDRRGPKRPSHPRASAAPRHLHGSEHAGIVGEARHGEADTCVMGRLQLESIAGLSVDQSCHLDAHRCPR